MKEENTLWINSLRGIACIIVVIAHIISVHPTIGIYASGCGKIGVWCFMVLSAYLLYRPYCREKRRFGIKECSIFYIKRAVRILPVYCVVLIWTYIIGYFTEIKEFFFHLIGLHGIGHLWYMPVIMKFYLVMPVFIIIKNMMKPIWNIVVLIVMLILGAVLNPYNEYVENSTELKWYMPVFIMGMLLAIIIGKGKKRQIANLKCYDLGVVFCIVIGGLFIPYMREKIWGMEPSGWLQNKYLLYGGLWAVIILCITFGKVIRNLLNKSKFLSYIGKISFSIYLIHYPILMELTRKHTNIWMNGLIVIVLSIVFASVINQFVEKPLERVRVSLMRA